MKVLHISTFKESGGAAISANRVIRSLEKEGVEVRLLYMFETTWWSASLINIGRFIVDRLMTLFVINSRRYLYQFSTGTTQGITIRKELLKWADVVHLHWVQFGMISIEDVKSLSALKPVVWSLHDMWVFTGGCHYAMECKLFRDNCNSCFYLRHTSPAAQRILEKKMETWSTADFRVVTSSEWLGDCAKTSAVLQGKNIRTIGTTLDLTLFAPLKRPVHTEKLPWYDPAFRHILVGAVDFRDERKGFSYLKRTLPEISEGPDNVKLVTFGKIGVSHDFGIDSVHLGSIDDETQLVQVYNAVDLFLMTSVQDNLPNTILESLACGLPVVGFNSGGIKDLVVTGYNGILVENRNSEDLAVAIRDVLQNDTLHKEMKQNARQHIEQHFSEGVIAGKYKKLYREMLRDFGTPQIVDT